MSSNLDYKQPSYSQLHKSLDAAPKSFIPSADKFHSPKNSSRYFKNASILAAGGNRKLKELERMRQQIIEKLIRE
jgi:hypothetical protein